MEDYTLVSVRLSFSMPPDNYTGICRHIAARMAEQKGLVWTVWPLDEVKREGGGVYLFENRRDAEACMQSPIIEQLRNTAGIYNVDIRISGIIDSLSLLPRD